jgi:hypothetical protein
VDERGESCKTIYGNFAENLENYIQRGHIPPFKKCFCPPTFVCKDLEKIEFVAFKYLHEIER